MVRSAFVISDIHLGASSSLFTAIDYDFDTEEKIPRPLAQDVVNWLIDELKARMYGEKIQQCILLGDIFDLSFAPYGLTMENGRWFFKQLVDSGLFEEFVYVPGNHDHHLWQQISEHYYLMTELENPPVNYPRTLPANFTLQNTFLDKLLPEGYGFQVTYPNYAFHVQGKPFYMHHGHFLQKLYVAASQFLDETIHTRNIEDLEVLNSPFLEFGWYNIGQAYNLGKQKLIDRFYYMVKNNKTEQLDKLLQLFMAKIKQWRPQRPKRRRWNILGMATDSVIQWLGPFLMRRILLKHSRAFGKRQHASSSRHQRLDDGLNMAVIEYLNRYIFDENTLHEECSFIFGHTHEPERKTIRDEANDSYIHIYNTGGWIVDQVDSAGQLVLPRMTPLLIGEDGSVNPILFTQNHHDALRTALDTEPNFQKIRAEMLQ